MKKLISLILSICILALTMLMSGCSGFMVDDSADSIYIKSIVPGVNEDGDVVLTINFTNEDIDPVVLPVPSGKDGEQGEQGETGNGILGVKHEHDDEFNRTKITITFTDEDYPPYDVYVRDGVMIEDINTIVDELTGETCIVLLYNDGTMSEEIPLPKGDPGVGIESYDQVVNDDKSVDTLFVLTNGEEIRVTIPAPQTGNGIEKMVSRTAAGLYIVDVFYTNGDKDSIDFKAPVMWYHGYVDPSKSTELANAVPGDYYFDASNKVIYVKGESRWEIVINFKDQLDEYLITFNLNAPDGEASMPAGYSDSYYVKRGTYFADNDYGDIPVPVRDGYNFVGWYTKKTVTVNMAPFTDLTGIMGNLDLYAIWEEK